MDEGDMANENGAKCTGGDRSRNILRYRIYGKLTETGRANLYQLLGLQVVCSDADITKRIEEIKQEHSQSGTAVGAELKYAMDILQDEHTRYAYDEKLWETLDDADLPTTRKAQSRADQDGSGSTLLEWWGTHKVTAIIGLASLAVVGNLGKGLFEAKSSHEIKKESIGVQKEAVKVMEQVEMARIENQKLEIEQRAKQREDSIELQRRNMEARVEAEERRRADSERGKLERMEIQEQQRKEREQRMQEAKANREKTEENRRAAGEQQYWSCFSSKLSRGYSTTDASVNCAHYHR
jgi:hypothetical protein